MVRRSSTVGAGMVSWLILLAFGVRAQPTAPTMTTSAEYTQLVQQLTDLERQGKVREALALCDQWLTAHPEPSPAQDAIGQRVVNSLKKLKGPQQLALCQRCLEKFGQSPVLCVYATRQVSQQLLWRQKQPEAALRVVQKAIDTLGDRLPRQEWSTSGMLAIALGAYRNLNRRQEGLEFARRMVLIVPEALNNTEFLTRLGEFVGAVGKPEERLGAARLAFSLGAMDERGTTPLQRLAAEALTYTRGPLAAQQFAIAQTMPVEDNPLRSVPLYQMADADALQQAAGGQPRAKITALLACGRFAQAVRQAQTRVQRTRPNGGWNYQQASQDMARCFRAWDLSVYRAYQYLDAGDETRDRMAAELHDEITRSTAAKAG